jgi:phosphatidylglycerophosphate synthase
LTGASDNTATGVRERPAGPPATAAATATAILFATAAARDGGPAAALRWEGEQTVVARLIDQLASLGIRRVHVVTRPAFEDAVRASLGAPDSDVRVDVSPSLEADLRLIADVARGSRGGVVVGLADIVTQREALAGLLVDPRHPTGVLATAAGHGRPYAPRARSRRGRVVSAASQYHVVDTPNHRFLGVIKLSPDARDELAAVAERLASLAAAPPPGWIEELGSKEHEWRTEASEPEGRDNTTVEIDEDELEHRLAVAPDDVTALLFVGLVRSGVHLGPSYVRRLYWSRPLSERQVERARVEITEHDEDRELLESAVKAADGFFTTFFVSPYSKYIARWAARRGFTPNQVTTVSLLIGLLAAAAFATGERWGLIAGAVLLQMAFTTDCVDGQLARYTRQFSKLGAWLDSVFDRTKEYLVFAGLAIGASHQGDPVWLLAGAALTLQTARHTMEFSWAATMHQQIGAAEHPPLEEPRDSAGVKAAARAAAKAARVEAAEPAHTVEAAPAPEAPAAAAPSPARHGGIRRGVDAWTALDRHPRALWVKRIIAFPIGERFAAISIAAAVSGARATFIVVLAWGGFATLYSLTGRVLRSIAA